MRKIKKRIADTTGDLIPAVLAGGVTGGPIGAIVGGLSSLVSPVVKDMLSRALSANEKERIKIVSEIAQQKISEHILLKHSLRKDLDHTKASELFEGVLLNAKNTYEAKKLPLIASLFATAPFTNTPIENLNQTLIFAEQLSYRQLCLLSIIGENMIDNKHELSDQPYMHMISKGYNECIEGIYQDILSLLYLGVIYQPAKLNMKTGMYINFAGYIVPNNLILAYSGLLLSNGLELTQIADTDKAPIIKVLKINK
jgi:hypothetical protein